MNTPRPTQPHVECLPLTANIRVAMTRDDADQTWQIYRDIRQPLDQHSLSALVKAWNRIVIKYPST